jgi:hypothetical protein
MQQALLPTGVLADGFSPPPAHLLPERSPGPYDLQQLGERLRVTYGAVDTSLPARLAELVEQLVRREQLKA